MRLIPSAVALSCTSLQRWYRALSSTTFTTLPLSWIHVLSITHIMNELLLSIPTHTILSNPVSQKNVINVVFLQSLRVVAESLQPFILAEREIRTVTTVNEKREEPLELLELLTRSIGRKEMKKYYSVHSDKIEEFLPHSS